MKTIAGAFLTIGLLAAALPMAAAQPLSGPLNYNVKNMTFDLWCLETQRYAPERCQARSPADVKAFEDYRAAIERYELNHLKDVQRQQQFQERINRDPTSTAASNRDSTP
jgi:hypothetical protein